MEKLKTFIIDYQFVKTNISNGIITQLGLRNKYFCSLSQVVNRQHGLVYLAIQ